MGEMKSLYTEGVHDLTSYSIGVKDGRKQVYEEIIDMITKSLHNPALEDEKITPRLSLAVLLAAIRWTADDEEKDETD